MIAILLAIALTGTPAQSLSGVVTDPTGAPLAGAAVTATSEGRRESTKTGADGSWTLALARAATTVDLRIDAPGFAPIDRVVAVPSSALRFALTPEAVSEHVIVSGEVAAPRLAVGASATTMDAAAIAAAPAGRLDDQLRSVPGFSLFRRTSSSVANPTTQGVTLRGLSASGASRALVVTDDVPLNDPFGGWVYWDRVPVASLQRVDVVRGASGDLHGNDALGGVIRLTSRTSRGAEAWLDAGSLNSQRASAYAAGSIAGWLGGAAVERAGTDGFVVIAPDARGPIDVRANSESNSGTLWGSGAAGPVQATVRAGYFSENRGNGTPVQVNATLTRWAAATAHGFAAGGVWEARGDVSANNYRQTFSAVAAGRASERLTNLQWVGSAGDDASVSWVRQTSRLEGLAAFTTRLLRANLDEASFSTSGVESAVTRTPPRQNGEGLVLQGRANIGSKTTVDAGVRGEYWRLSRADVPGARRALSFVAPRIGVTVDVADAQTIRVAWLTGFRVPTMNELYRSFRVGSTNTQANTQLAPERSSGPEAAYTVRRERWTARAILYETSLRNAIYNRTVSQNGAAIVRQRANGGARTVGSELELEWRVRRGWAFTTSWAVNDARFTSGELQGRKVPQVPRAAGSIGGRAEFGAFSAAATVRAIGAQFDDDLNQFTLGAGSLADARIAWRVTRRAEVFAAIENAANAEIDTGRTPVLTIGPPRTGRAGLALRF